MDESRVTVTFTVPPGLSREVVDDRLHLVFDGLVTLPAAGFVASWWDTSGIPEREKVA